MPTSVCSPLPIKQQRPCSGRNIKAGFKSSKSVPCMRTLGKVRKSSANSYISSSSRISSGSAKSNGSVNTPRKGGAPNSARTSVSRISSRVSQPRIVSAGVCQCKRRIRDRKTLVASRKILSATHRPPKDGEEASRVLSTLLLIRGISSRNENHPLPERPEDALPLQYLESVKEALSSYVTTSASGMSSPTSHEEASANNFLVLSHNSHNGWTTGNSTERSSLFSWADDEFDKQAAKTVQKMFDEIDDMLFEEHKNASTSLQIQNECKEWNGRFPHLRILGHQMMVPGDEGYQYYPSARPATAGELLDVGDHEVPGNASPVPQDLSISGKHLNCLKAPPSADKASSGKGDTMLDPTLAYLDEEIYETDGYVEGYFAYDSYQDDEEHERKKYHAPRRRPGFPPVTPNAVLQNTVLSETFDVLWAEVVVWMRTIVRKHAELISEENRFAAQDDNASQMSSLRPVAQNYDLGFSPTPYGQHTGRLMDLQSGKLASMTSSLKLNSTAPSSFNYGVHPEQQRSGALNSVMTISSKALHNKTGARAPSALGDDSSMYGGASANRPGSSNFIARSNRPMSVRTAADNFSYNNYRQPSARGAKGRLKPLDGRAKTPQLEGMITGKKIVTANERLGSPPYPTAPSPSNNYQWSRNNTLPPIEISQQENSNQFPMRPMKSQNKFRISSAVMDDRGLRSKDKGGYPAFVADSRPSTTHAFRDETFAFGGAASGRRSSTPHAFSALRPPGSATGNRGNVPRITGVSLGIPGSQSHIETSSVGPYGGPQPNYFRVL